MSAQPDQRSAALPALACLAIVSRAPARGAKGPASAAAFVPGSARTQQTLQHRLLLRSFGKQIGHCHQSRLRCRCSRPGASIRLWDEWGFTAGRLFLGRSRAACRPRGPSMPRSVNSRTSLRLLGSPSSSLARIPPQQSSCRGELTGAGSLEAAAALATPRITAQARTHQAAQSAVRLSNQSRESESLAHGTTLSDGRGPGPGRLPRLRRGSRRFAAWDLPTNFLPTQQKGGGVGGGGGSGQLKAGQMRTAVDGVLEFVDQAHCSAPRSRKSVACSWLLGRTRREQIPNPSAVAGALAQSPAPGQSQMRVQLGCSARIHPTGRPRLHQGALCRGHPQAFPGLVLLCERPGWIV